MPSGNFDEPVTASTPPTLPPRTFQFPCAYYSAPLSEVRPIFPKWVPLGCGTASAVLIVLLFAGGAMLTGPRLAAFMDFAIGMSLGELKGMYTADVTAAQKEHFDEEVKRLRDGLGRNAVTLQKMQPFLKAMQSAMTDKKVTGDEVERLTAAAHDAALPARKSRT